MKRFVMIVSVGGLILTFAALAHGETLHATLQFTVPTEERPIALSHNMQADGTWAVLYGDTGRIRFFSMDGTQVASYTPDLSPSIPYEGYANPRYADIVNIDDNDCHGALFGLMGDPSSSHDSVYDGTKYVAYAKLIMSVTSTLASVRGMPVRADRSFSISRWEPSGNFRWTIDDDAMLSTDGTMAFTRSDGRQFDLSTYGIIQAQSLALRGTDKNLAILHDNMLTILQRKYERHVTETITVPDSEVGKVLAEYQITGLPPGALLIDADSLFATDGVHWPTSDTFYVLDQTTGGVYALPEPATVAVLSMGGLLMLRKRGWFCRRKTLLPEAGGIKKKGAATAGIGDRT